MRRAAGRLPACDPQLTPIEIHIELAKAHNFVRPHALIQDQTSKIVEVCVFCRAQEISPFLFSGEHVDPNSVRI